jgi:uncharacterized protein
MKLNKYCELKKSKIHGKGVFAITNIPKGKDIVQYTGKLVSKKEGTKIAEKQLKSNLLYVFSLNKKYDIDGMENGSGAQYINHSCKPNCESINYDDKEIWIQSIRKIKKGEELTYDYGFDDDSICNCGSKDCNGIFFTDNGK